MKHLKVIVIIFSMAIVGLITLQINSIKTSFNYAQDMENTNWRTKKIGQAYLILNLLLDIETSARGYIITGIPKFLDPYHFAEKRLPEELKTFYTQLAPSEVELLSSLIELRVQKARKAIERKKNNEPISSIQLEEGKKVMDEVREAIQSVVESEKASLNYKSNLVKTSFNKNIIQQVGGSLLSFLLIALSAYFVYQEFKKRARAEKKLQSSLATSEAIARNIDFGIIACDPMGEIIFSNNWILSKTYQHIGYVQDLIATNSLAKIPLEKMLKGEIEKIEQLELQFKNEKIVFDITSSPFQINDQSQGFLLSIVDTTEATKRMTSLSTGKKEAELASSNKSEFLAKMSHEIRTPLNAILGVSEILSLTKLNAEQERCVGIFQRSAQTLINLVNDILDLSKIEAGKIEIYKQPFSLKNLIYSCTSIMDFRASQKGLLFTTEVIGDGDHFIGDENRMRQVLLNVLGNAIKFTEHGQISFKVECESVIDGKQKLRFTVKDTGRGISQNNIGKLFSNYQQESAKISSEYGGTGLGLSLSRELARLMGGDIEIKSELGKGSEFTFHTTLEVANGVFVEEKGNLNIKFSQVKILLVDDNEENRFIVKRYLNDYDIQITEAVDGEHAIEVFQSDKFDLIFMDINMPKKNGLAATEDIRKLEKDEGLEKTCIIALSANALTQEYEKAKLVGCDDYLTKPISRSKLVNTMSKWLKNSGKVFEEESEDLSDEEVDIDEEIKALIPAYIEKRKMDLKTLKEALIKKDNNLIGAISHSIKGTALSYGQVDLDKIAYTLNTASKESNWDNMEKAIQEMEAYLSTKNGN